VSVPDPRADGAGYAEAMAELESILRALEEDELDIDVLAGRVARAADLIRWCRSRIDGARLQVEHVVADLESEIPPA